MKKLQLDSKELEELHNILATRLGALDSVGCDGAEKKRAKRMFKKVCKMLGWTEDYN